MEKEKKEYILKTRRKVILGYLPEIIAGLLLMIVFFVVVLIILH